MIDISRALTIPGFMSETELAWLGNRASEHERIVEIGSYLGRSTRALADNTLGTVYSVDTWEPMKEVDWMHDFLHTKEEDYLFKTFVHNMADRLNVIAYRMTSEIMARAQAEQKFDMVFIDGAHDYQSVSDDIQDWIPLLAQGGLLCGHDIDHEGVLKAVRTLVPNYRVVEGTTIWHAV